MLLTAYLLIMALDLAGIIYLLIDPSDCPDCGFIAPCAECNAKFMQADEILARSGK